MTHIFIDEIHSLERLRLSESGNPHFQVRWKSGRPPCRTKPDAAVNHGIENAEFRHRQVEVTLEKGLIVYINPVQ